MKIFQKTKQNWLKKRFVFGEPLDNRYTNYLKFNFTVIGVHENNI